MAMALAWVCHVRKGDGWIDELWFDYATASKEKQPSVMVNNSASPGSVFVGGCGPSHSPWPLTALRACVRAHEAQAAAAAVPLPLPLRLRGKQPPAPGES